MGKKEDREWGKKKERHEERRIGRKGMGKKQRKKRRLIKPM